MIALLNTELGAQGAMLAAFLLPFLGAILVLLFARVPVLRETATLIIGALTFFCVLSLLHAEYAATRIDFIDAFPGVPIRFELEPLGLVFALIASGLWIIATIYSIGYMYGNKERNLNRFFVFFAISIGATLGIAFSGNLLTLFVFYEVLTLCTYPLVTHSGKPEAKAGGRTYLGILMTTSILFLLFAVIWTYWATGTLDFRVGGILADKVGDQGGLVLLFLFVYGIGKAALMPFHRWLPAAMVAPTPVSALLHAVAVVKAGVFSVVKIIVYVFGTGYLTTLAGSEWIVYIAGFTIVAASLIALRQDNLKRLLAFSTVSQLSYVVMAAAVLAPLSVMGAVIHIAAHAFGKITLFFAAGSIYTASKKTKVSELDGVGRAMPWTMVAFTIAVLSMIGLPPTAGFISKWYMLQGAVQADNAVVITVLIVSTLLNTAYFMPIVYRAFFRPLPAGVPVHGEAPFAIVLAIVLTAGLTLAFFFLPDLFIELARATEGGF